MPGITVSRALLFERLGQAYSDEAFADLCFAFGIELDDVVRHVLPPAPASPRPVPPRLMSQHDADTHDAATYKIDIPANRYDLLCLEGLARALRLFLGSDTTLPAYRTVTPPEPIKLTVQPSVRGVRPVLVGAVLRGLRFTPANYASFIELQEKLHANLCRRRTLVSIGTHDLGTLEAPFSYEALPPKEIVFRALNQTESLNAEVLFGVLEKDLHLRPFLPIIRDSPVYPVIFDARRTVCSLPPIINGHHSRITLETTDVLVEVTAVDTTKANAVLDTLCAMFAEYAADRFAVEQVAIVNDGETSLTPQWVPRTVSASLAYLEKALGVPLVRESIPGYLSRMGVSATLKGDEVQVTVPPTRTDLIHACDILEDVAIGYGFPKLVDAACMPGTVTAGRQNRLNKRSDQLRAELAHAGYTEVLTLSLQSRQDNYASLGLAEDGKAVVLANPKTLEYQVARTSLFAGLFKTLQHNRQAALPLRLFEVSDVVWQSAEHDVGARNRRMLCALYCSTHAAFEQVHGLLDHVMRQLDIAHHASASKDRTYRLEASEHGTFFPGRCARVLVDGRDVGVLGVVHPTVLANFELAFPVSALHLDLELLV